jgi:hypothetical protein
MKPEQMKSLIDALDQPNVLGQSAKQSDSTVGDTTDFVG